jgi:glutathione peroxidase
VSVYPAAAAAERRAGLDEIRLASGTGRSPGGGRRQGAGEERAMTSIYEFSATDIDGKEQALSRYKGKALLVVNVASKCGFTPQYAGLEALQRKFAGKGFAVLGFPCDQFGHQEPGDEQEIKNFCSLTYDVSFPMFAKVAVNGDGAHPLYQFLKKAAKGLLGSEAIKWNFTKFLVDKDGKVVGRSAPTYKPESIEMDVAALVS